MLEREYFEVRPPWSVMGPPTTQHKTLESARDEILTWKDEWPLMMPVARIYLVRVTAIEVSND